MVDVLVLLWSALTSLFRSRGRLEAEILVLRQQINVLRRPSRKRFVFGTFDRLVFVGLYRLVPGIVDALSIVRPETVVRWHRAGFRLFWRWKSRRRGGRPRIPLEIRKLIRDMSLANPLWGAPRIHGELLKLGIDVGQTSVAKYMAQRRGGPSPGWRTFLCNHADGIACMDLFVVPTLSFRRLYGLLILRHRRRQIKWLGVTANRTAEWIARQITEACGWAAAPDYVVRDRDRAYGEAFIRRLRAMGIRDRPTAPRIALAERLCRTPDWLDQAGGTRSRRRAWRASPSARTAILHGISQRGPHASVAEQRRADSTRSSRRRSDQDTNALQAQILLRMKPDGRGLTVVGDDAQSIYSFRAATVRNILDFPKQFTPPARVVTLERNCRSTEPILAACNAVIGQASEGFRKELFSDKPSGERPQLVVTTDEAAQVDYVVECVLEHREAGIDLKRQAVLFRASQHSDQLEVELARRGIPFVKYGGLKFLEAAHVKDVLCVLRWIENPRDAIAAFRVLQLLPGIGPATAHEVLTHLSGVGWDFAALGDFRTPAATAPHWPEVCNLLSGLRQNTTPWAGQMALVRRWYQPHLERLYDNPGARIADLDQMGQIAGTYPTPGSFLTELALDPPQATSAEPVPPHLDEDYLILSTIHSAKGQEWDAVFVLNVIDGSIPSDMAVGKL